MKQIIILSVLTISTFGAKLNQYLPPRPENHNAQFQPPALPTGNLPEQPFEPPQFDQINQQRNTPKSFEQSGQPSSPFSQKNVPGGNVYGVPEQSSSSFGQFSQKTSPSGYNNGNTQQPAQKNSFNGNIYDAPEQSGQSSSPSSQLPQKNTFGTNPSRQYLTPNNKDNSFGPTTGYSQVKTASFGPKSQELSINQFSNQGPTYNGQNSNDFNQQNKFPGAQSNFGPQSAPIGLIRSEINPNAGDGHYNYLYETENGITVQEEGLEKTEGKSAQGGFSYTSPEGEQISIEYTAGANGFIPKGSHVPEIPEAIAKSIELNKAAEARGEYNEGSYKEEYNDEPTGYQGNAPTGQTFNSYQAPQTFGNQNNGYKNSGPARTNNVSDQGTFASQDNKQVAPFGQANNVPGSQTPFGQQNNVLSTAFGQQNNGPKSYFGQNNNGHQYSAPGKTNFIDQGTFASTPNKQVTPFGQQNNVPSTAFGQQNNGPKSSFGQNNNGYQYSAPGTTSFVDHGTFASTPSGQVTPFGQQNNVPSTAFGQQNNGPKFTFGQQNNGGKSASNDGYQYPTPEQNSFANQQIKKVAPFGSQETTPSAQYTPRQQYEAPGQAYTKNNKEVPSGQFGTVQDNQGGYKY